MLGGFLTLFVSLSMRGQLSRVPGLALYPDFLSEAEGAIAATAARRLSQSAAAAAKGMVGSTSRNHNVNQREEYVRVTLQDDDDAASSLPAEHFSSYGEGHNLTYFRGHLPRFGLDLPSRLAALPEVREDAALASARAARDVAGSPLKWRVTLNRYAARRGGGAASRAGFPWHVDLHANGAVSCILGLGDAGGELEFAEGRGENGLQYDDSEPRTADHGAGVGEDARAVVARVQVPPRGLLVLAGPARWDFLHRVVRAEGADAERERLSLVYGAW